MGRNLVFIRFEVVINCWAIFIWSLNCLVKIKILVWKFVWNYIPTFQNLHFRLISLENRCLRCHDVNESNIHVAPNCLFAKKKVWLKLNYQWPVLITKSSFIEWLYWVFENITSYKKDKTTITIWAIWFARNKLLHDKKE